MEYARKMGNTTVVVLPDHGNSGFSIGRKDLANYAGTSIEKLFGTVSKVKYSAQGIEKRLKAAAPSALKETFKSLTGIELTASEDSAFHQAKTAKNTDYTEAGEGESLTNLIVKTLNSRMYFGFTSTGHTGEEVFLAAYHPKGHIPLGNLRNNEINNYLFRAAGLKKPLKTLTSEIYARHTDVFKGMNMSISKNGPAPELTIKNGNKTLIIPAYSSIVNFNGNNQPIGSVTVYVDKTETFYLSAKLKDLLK
jgi:alkaline phosphatase